MRGSVHEGHDERRHVDRHDVVVDLPLVAGEIVHAIPDDRAAERAAELLLAERHFARGKRVRLVEGVVAQKVIAAAAEPVAAGLGQDVDHAAPGAAELDGVLIGDDLELLHRFLREGVARGIRQTGAAAGHLVVDVDALEPQRLELFVEPAERDRVGGALADAVSTVTPGASSARSTNCRPFTGRSSTSAGLMLVSSDFSLVSMSGACPETVTDSWTDATLQVEVERQVAAERERDVLALDRGKPGHSTLHRVAPGRQFADAIAAAFAGGDRSRQSRVSR